MRRLGVLVLLLAPALARAEARNETSPRDASNSETAPTDSPTVVGGNQVPAGRWPDAVAVIGDTGTCTGTLIAPDVVLTAGHCAEISPSEIVANTPDYGQGGTSIAVASVTAYPSWQTSFDLAVLKLVSPVPNVAPRAVGTSCTFASLDAGTLVHLVGFGLTDEAGDGTNTALHEAMAPVVDPDCMDNGEGCRASLRPGGEFVAGGDGTDSCFGDSGGPVYLDTPRGSVLVGAVSRGVSGAGTPCGNGGIYERTDRVIPWIEQVAGEAIAIDSCTGAGSGETVSENSADVQALPVVGGCAAAGGAGGVSGAAAMAIGTLALLGLRRRGMRSSGSGT
jgi:secreted trypsin-like serine protease